MKIRAALLAGLLLLIPLSLQAQTSATGVTIPLFSAYDLASTDLIYCATYGDSSGFAKEAWKKPDPRSKVVTSGSSTTVTSLSTGVDAFTNVAAGDELRIQIPTGTVANTTNLQYLYAYVATRVSATEITVGTAIDLGTAGVSFEYRTRTCGTTATSGMIPVAGYDEANFQFELTTLNATSISFDVECKVAGSNTTWVTVIPTSGASVTLTAAAKYSNTVFKVNRYDYCRMGMILVADGGAQSVTGSVRLTK